MGLDFGRTIFIVRRFNLKQEDREGEDDFGNSSSSSRGGGEEKGFVIRREICGGGEVKESGKDDC